jgi:signal transduction histidine kinase/ActR/RegA family two-component response regulator
MGEGAAAVLLSEEALVPAAARMVEALEAQPPWSDLPILVSAIERDMILEGHGAVGPLGKRCNVTVLDRPVHVHTLVNTVRGALRARHRQYQARDVLAQLAASEASERDARARAEEMSRAKDEFLATVSHELRTPLSGILGWARLLSGGILDDTKQKRAVEAIERNAVAQAQLIEDLLDVSRIIGGKMRLDLDKVELRAVIDAAIESVRPAMDAKKIRFQCLIDPAASPIMGDPNRLQQIVWNLLSNAIKFTAKEGRIQLSLARVDSHVELTVSDNGRGIDPSFLPYLFERFRQADSSTTRAYGGLGLGLAICRHLVELHGGTIEAYSEGASHGSTFVVRFPMLSVQPVDPTQRAHPSLARSVLLEYPPELRGLKVLVVDDEPEARELLLTLLTEGGAETRQASSAIEALDAIAERPDVVISDIGMPGMDGYELIRRIRALPPDMGGRTPAAALTAYARAEDRRLALRAGFEMFVPKPVEPAEFLQVVATLARIHRAMK